MRGKAMNKGYTYRLELGTKAQGHTVISYLTSQYDHSTQEQWLARLEAGQILLGGQVAFATQALQPGLVLIWNRPPWQEPTVPKDYQVLYQDEALLAVDKPSGLPTLPGAGFYEHTLLNLVKAQFPSAIPLHRLGRATSGLVLFALQAPVASVLGKSWSKVHKQYRALSTGIASQDTYQIQAAIGPVQHTRLGFIHAASPTGKASHSTARVLERQTTSTLFEVDLHTGRPHQIRIHLAYIGHPLLGDPLYSADLLLKDALPGDSGYHLHAKSLLLEHPLTHQPLNLDAPPPKVLRKSVE
jgi:23S rRNA pseudouridine1911/1915/1917 synthase